MKRKRAATITLAVGNVAGPGGLRICAVGACFFGATFARSATAQDLSAQPGAGGSEPSNSAIFRHHVTAPRRALEVQVSGGYQQGVGSLGGDPAMHVQEIAGVGAGGEVSVGYRWSPQWLVGLYGSGAWYSAVANGEAGRSFATGVQGQLHLRPRRAIDPWVGLGIGYRVFSFDRAGQGSSVHQAIQLPRMALGVDYRVSPFVAVGPFINADLSLFLREPRPGQPTETKSTLSTFVSAGISARFDLLGSTGRVGSQVAAP
jgi:hypothetical protein